MNTAFVFPGQGSQTIGMGQALAESFPIAREIFQQVDDALKQNLSQLMFSGDPDTLNLTENAQPALMAVSIAAMRVLESQLGIHLAKSARFVAGHSLGEYSALTAAGSFPLDIAAKLLKTRGTAMQQAVPVGIGGMSAILGLDSTEVENICAADPVTENGTCQLANDNCPGQIVISGHKAAVEAAGEMALEEGARKVVALPVSAPFHCRLMQPAADVMKHALANVDILAPCVPLIANVIAKPTTDPEMIRKLLVTQVTDRVRWTETLAYMQEQGIETIIEVGVGKVLSGLARRANREFVTLNIGEPADLDTLGEALQKAA